MFAAVLRRRLKLIFWASLSIAIAASGLEIPVSRNVSVSLPAGAQVEIGTVRTRATLLGFAAAQVPGLEERLDRIAENLAAPSTVTLENLTLDYGYAVFRMPKIEFSGVTLSRADLLGLFDANASEAMATRLERLSAKQVLIPELIVEQRVGPQRQVTRYRGIAATDLVGGRVVAIVSEGASFETRGSDSDMSGTIGRLSISDLDMVETARVYAEQAGDTPSEPKRLYGAFALDDLAVATTKGVRIGVARMAGRELFARPTKQSLVELMRGLGAPEMSEKPSLADQTRVLAAFAELYEATQIGMIEAAGIAIADPSDASSARIERIGYTAGKPGQPADIRIEGLDIGPESGRARIDLVALAGFSLDSTIAGIKALGAKPLQEIDAAALRSLIPTVGTIRLSGIDFDAPQKANEPKRDNIRFAINALEVTADRPLNGIPTHLRLGMDGLRLPLREDTTEDVLKDLVALGYRDLDLSWLAAASWREAENELAVSEVSVRGREMGVVSLRGVLGSVTKEVFNPDRAVALVALLGATVKNADLAIENGGLFERLVAQEARKQKKTADELRREFGVAAAVAVPVMLGNSASAKAIGQAVARFVAKPGKLSIAARTKDPAGLGVTDLVTLAEPGAILGRLDVAATAE